MASTFLSILALLDTPTRGRYWFQGRRVERSRPPDVFAPARLCRLARLPRRAYHLPAMSREDILALFARRDTAWKARDAHALAQSHAIDGVVISPTGGVLEGRDEIERVYGLWFSAFPDLTFTSEDLLIDGSRAVQVVTVSGTHTGDFFGVPPTGRRVSFACAIVVSVANGEVAHERRILDFTGVLIQVGVLKAKPR